MFLEEASISLIVFETVGAFGEILLIEHYIFRLFSFLLDFIQRRNQLLIFRGRLGPHLYELGVGQVVLVRVGRRFGVVSDIGLGLFVILGLHIVDENILHVVI